jgi:hypothetical protein
MATITGRFSAFLLLACCALTSANASQRPRANDDEFGPVVRAYLGYLKDEQEVVDDRASRREVSASYYRHNSNRIRALRQIAMKLARETHNDYLPELEAVSADEMRLLFGSNPPQAARLKVGEVLRNTFRFLGVVRSGETFYLFARLDPYEQAELQNEARQRRVKLPDLDPSLRLTPGSARALLWPTRSYPCLTQFCGTVKPNDC